MKAARELNMFLTRNYYDALKGYDVECILTDCFNWG